MKTRNLQFWVSCPRELELTYMTKYLYLDLLFILSFSIISLQCLHIKPLLFEELLVHHCSFVITHVGLHNRI